eukprot:2840207-Rhodomonas_salina.1
MLTVAGSRVSSSSSDDEDDEQGAGGEAVGGKSGQKRPGMVLMAVGANQRHDFFDGLSAKPCCWAARLRCHAAGLRRASWASRSSRLCRARGGVCVSVVLSLRCAVLTLVSVAVSVCVRLVVPGADVMVV